MAFITLSQPTSLTGVVDLGLSAARDGVTDPNGAITSGAAALSTTSNPGPFTAAMVGRPVVVMGAGTSGADFYTTILSFTDSQHVTLTANAATTVSGARLFVLNHDDYPAFTSALASVCANGGGVLRLPAGVYFMDYATAASVATASGNGIGVVIQGSGKGNTWIVPSGNTGPQGGVEWLLCNAGNSLEVYDASVLAPAWQTSTFTAKGIEHGGGTGYVQVDRCNLWGFASGLQLDPGTAVDAWVSMCDFTCSPVLNFGGAAIVGQAIGGALRVLDCAFHDFGVAASNQNHGLYLYQGLEYHLRGCRFYNQRGTGYGVHNFNGTGTAAAASIEHCDFEATTVNAILTNPTVRQRIAFCDLLGTGYGITTQADCDIEGGRITGFGAAFYGIIQKAATPASTVDVRNVKIVPALATNNAAQVQVAGSVWTFTGCEFGCNQAAAVVINAGGSIERGCIYADSGSTHDVLVVRGITAPSLGSVNAGLTGATLSGNDDHGTVTFSTTASPPGSDSALFTVTFATAQPTAPIVLAQNMRGDRLAYLCPVVTTTTGFTVYNSTALSASLAGWIIGYKVIPV